MDADRWRRLEELFDRAAALRPDEREAFLDRACADDTELRERILALLKQDGDSEGFIAGMIEQVAADPDFERRVAGQGGWAEGDRIGPYRILGEIGRGGMGVVYLAERADEAYRQRVAIKLVRHAAEGAVDRFLRERQILADLQHPGIARLLDGGTTPDGRPYLVLEYVLGEPIDAYCARNRLPLDERLRLFREVCAAVQFAHESLVVHRDLKPGNILVTADGHAKLLDFGIARLLDSDGAQSDATRTLGRVLTPEYASPEQVRGGRVTTASDVYSLGVLLYVLLTGARPYDVDTDSPTEVERIVCDTVPSAASTAAPPSMARSIRGDLDWITFKALAKEPERRYGTAAQLGEDIDRHLRQEPVVAGPPSVRYRAGRYIRRHRVAVFAASAVLVALVVGAALAGVGFVRATRAREIAERDAASALEVTAFLQEMLASVKPDQARGREVTVREILDSTVGRLDGRFDEPEVEAAVRFAVGDSYQALGDFATALPLLERAVELRRRELGTEDARFREAVDRLGMVYWLTGDYAGSLRCSEELLAIYERLDGPESPRYTQTLGNLANTYADMGDLARSEELHRQALAIERRTLVGDDRGDLAYTLNNLATVLADRAKFDEAVTLHRESLAIRLDIQGEDSPAVVISKNNLGYALHGAERYDEAEAILHEAIALGTHVLGPEHVRVTSARVNLGEVLAATGRLAEAEAAIRAALADMLETAGERSWRVGAARGTLGEVLVRAGRAAEGETELRVAIDLLEEALGPEHPRTVEVRAALAAVDQATGVAARE